MDLDDDDLALLGFGNQWQETSHKIAVHQSKQPEIEKQKSLDRVKLHHRLFPGSHAKAISNWQKRNPDKVKKYQQVRAQRNLRRFGFMIGKKCVVCGVGTHLKSEIESGSFNCKECKS